MKLNERDVEYILQKVQPKIFSASFQTNPSYKEDLEQEMKEMIVRKIEEGKINVNVPGFFEYLNMKKEES